MKISAYTIVKDSERFIEAMVEHIIPHVDELVLAVSQESKDNTTKLVHLMADKYKEKIKVYFYSKEWDCKPTKMGREWDNEWSLRNEAKGRCTGDWIIQQDTDEFWCEEFLKNSREYARRAEDRGFFWYFFPKMNFWNGFKQIRIDGNWSPDIGGIKFFKNNPDYNYIGKLHCTVWADKGRVMFPIEKRSYLPQHPILHFKMLFNRPIEEDASPEMRREKGMELVDYEKELPKSLELIKC